MYTKKKHWFNWHDLRWLRPGMRFKRWIILIVLGTWLGVTGLEVAIGPVFITPLWVQASRVWAQIAVWLDMASSTVSRSSGFLMILLGLATVAYAIRQLLRSVAEVLFKGNDSEFFDYYLTQMRLRRGPKVVAIGGGTGLSTLLRGLKEYTSNITAIVTVADNGGSSGRLREELGTLPPGDIRSCIVALADAEPLMKKLFQHRYGPEFSGLEGHSFGNIFIATMSEITGDFETAVRESSKVLAVRGRVLPSTLEDVALVGHFTDGSTVEGEAQIPKVGKRISRVELRPGNVRPPEEAIRALQEADLIVLGPGSLYTSVIPNILVAEIRRAVMLAKCPVVYVCNIMTQPGETDGYTVSDHLKALADHLGKGVVDYVVANVSELPSEVLAKYEGENAKPVVLDQEAVEAMGVKVLTGHFATIAEHVRHSPLELAGFLLNLIQ